MGTILVDLSEAYNCIPHDKLIAKLECDGIDKIGLSFILDYFSGRRQKAKISFSYSSWYDIVRGVSQDSILGPLLFNLLINYLFLLSRCLKHVTLPMKRYYKARKKS